MRQHLLLIITLTIIIDSKIYFAQKSWLYQTPSGYINEFFVGMGSSTESESEAEDVAIKNAFKNIAFSKGIIIEPSSTIMKVISKRINNKTEKTIEIADSIKVTTLTTIVKSFRIWDKFYKYENGIYSFWVLVSIPKENQISPPTAISTIWRSFIIPGWGQLYKEESLKGIFFMVSGIGGVATGIILKQLSIDSENNALNSRTQARRDYYNDQTKTYDTFSKISFIVAGVAYVWSLIDAITVPYSNLYVNLEQIKNNTVLSICYRF